MQFILKRADPHLLLCITNKVPYHAVDLVNLPKGNSKSVVTEHLAEEVLKFVMK